MGIDLRIAELAEGQHGIVTRGQLVGLGLSAAQVERRVECGALLRVHQGVYAVGHRSTSREARWIAAVRASGAGAVLSHRSAGELWRVVPLRGLRPEVTRPRKHKARSGVLAHQASIPPDEVDEIEGIPITSVFRTIFDLAAVAQKREVERAFHEAEVRRLTDRVSLPMLLQRHPGRRGAAVIRELLADRRPTGITRNDFEERFVAFLDAHGLPRPLLNGTLPLRGRLLSPDCMWPRERLLAELDSREVHDTDRAFEGDRKRDRELLAEGWRSTRVTWRQLRDEPEAVAADLRRLLNPPA